MKHIFFTILLAFLASLLLFIGILSVTFLFGYRRSALGWGSEMRKISEEEVYKELINILTQEAPLQSSIFEKRLEPIIPHNAFLAVYDINQKLLYIHSRQPHGQGMGMMRTERMGQKKMSNLPLIPLKADGHIRGYYRMGPFGFGMDRANIKFLESMI